jgi:hypothetical protein
MLKTTETLVIETPPGMTNELPTAADFLDTSSPNASTSSVPRINITYSIRVLHHQPQLEIAS